MRQYWVRMPQEKIRTFGLVLFAFVGVSALVLGVVQARQNITQPFTPDARALAEMSEQLNADDINGTKDTDGDGITDFDELTLYRTSPYIRDSDSDGIDDKTEIEKGTDPNCPQGKDCGMGTTASTGSMVEINPLDTGAETDTEAVISDPDYERLVNGVTDPKELRELLIKVGISKEQLDLLDDETVLKLYQDTMQGSDSPNANATP